MENVRSTLQEMLDPKTRHAYGPAVRYLQTQSELPHGDVGEIKDPLGPAADRIKKTHNIGLERMDPKHPHFRMRDLKNNEEIGHLKKHDNGQWYAHGPSGERSGMQTDYHDEPHKAVRDFLDRKAAKSRK